MGWVSDSVTGNLFIANGASLEEMTTTGTNLGCNAVSVTSGGVDGTDITEISLTRL
jgi:hypothetical protein